jgi:hypothetical protein
MKSKEKKKYKYHFRPGYNSEKLIIEIFDVVDGKKFGKDFLAAIKEISPKVVKDDENWDFDSASYDLYTDLGKAILSMDAYDLVFIEADDNQNCLIKIDSILQNDERFEKVEVDSKNYN